MLIEELKIGNYVEFNKSVCSVVNIITQPDNFIYVKDNTGIVHTTTKDCILPIELTEKWLDIFNYCIDEEDSSLYEDRNLFDDYDSYYTGNRFSIEDGAFYINDAIIKTDIKIIYVHQFQNWHYLLNGDIKVKKDLL